MKLLLAVLAGAGVALSTPAAARTNNNDYTPLNSRIKRDRQFPTEPRSTFALRELSRVERNRSRDMANQFARCLFDRSNEDALTLLSQTDFGFVDFQQMGMTSNQVLDNYAIDTCLSRVAATHNSGVTLRYTPDAMRRWMLAEAYLDRYPDGPNWAQPGYVVAERSYPLSADNVPVQVAMNFADCVVTQDPHAADYLFRTAANSAEEQSAIQGLVPVMRDCLPAGQQVELQPYALRLWVGEGLWHAANNSSPPPAEISEGSQ